jgi:hypothetical protein
MGKKNGARSRELGVFEFDFPCSQSRCTRGRKYTWLSKPIKQSAPYQGLFPFQDEEGTLLFKYWRSLLVFSVKPSEHGHGALALEIEPNWAFYLPERHQRRCRLPLHERKVEVILCPLDCLHWLCFFLLHSTTVQVNFIFYCATVDIRWKCKSVEFRQLEHSVLGRRRNTCNT